MTLEITRRIRGNLHGSTDISELEDQVISHPNFQRLRNIKQTAFLSYVFPGATHSRFEHSLGVLHLASIAWEKIKENQRRIKKNIFEEKLKVEQLNEEKNEVEKYHLEEEKVKNIFSSSYCLQTLRLAALLHDIGHPPLSHTGEIFLPNLSTILESNPNLPEYLKKYIKTLIKKETQQCTHEIYSIMLIDQILSEIYKKYKSLKLKVHPQDVVSLLIKEISPHKDSQIEKFQVQDLFHELISGDIDFDRMDYLLRDSKECGVIYGLFDIDRILESLAIYDNKNDGKLHLSIHFSGLAAYEDYLRARQSMYLQLYFHKTSVACEAMLRNISKNINGCQLPANISQYTELDDHSIYIYFCEKIKNSQLKLCEKEKNLKILRNVQKRSNLWKRVYEVSFCGDSPLYEKQISKVTKSLKENNCNFEVVRSYNQMTTKNDTLNDENYLKLIKKNEKQILTVAPIKDYSPIYTNDQNIQICRIYAQATDSKDNDQVLEKARAVVLGALNLNDKTI